MKEKIISTLRDEQLKQVYYIIALTTTCIGFSIYKTQESLFNLNLITLGGAVLSWGLSIFFGFRFISYTLSNLYANYKLLDVQDGNINKILDEINFKGIPNIGLIEIATKGIIEAMEENGDKRSFYGNWQLYLFYFGGFLFIIWHILEIYIRTITLP